MKKSSTLIMAIILVAQAVLIMGVVSAAVSIENSAAAVGDPEKKVTMEEPNNKLLNTGNLTCCDACNPVSPQSDLFKCQDVFKSPQLCAKSKCRNCANGKKWKTLLTCNDEFNGRTCGPQCPKN